MIFRVMKGDEIIYEGTRKECLAVDKAFKKLGNTDHHISEVDENTWGLTSKEVDRIYSFVAEMFSSLSCGASDFIGHVVCYGFTGLDDYSVEDLVKEAENLDHAADSEIVELVDKYRGNQQVNKVLEA